MRKLIALIMLTVLAATAGIAFASPADPLEGAAAPEVSYEGLREQVTGKSENAEASTDVKKPKATPYVYRQVSGHYFEAVPLDAELQDVLFTCCDEYGISYAIALGLIQTESRFELFVVNGESGCYGLCQLNPMYFPSGLCPAENIRHGMAYLAERIEYYGGDIVRGLQAYKNYLDNGGRTYPNTVLAYAAQWEQVL